MNGDPWRTPSGQIGAEVDRKPSATGDLVKLATLDTNGWPVAVWHWLSQLTPVEPRYRGARGGHG